MATVGKLDFEAFVERRKARRAGGAEGGGHAYAYVSDHKTRMTFERLKPVELAVRDRDIVRVRVPGDRELVFGSVVVRVSPDWRLDMHIDTDEANAAELGAGAVGYLDSIQERATGL